MRIEQLMTRPVVTCRADDDINHAAHLMWEHDVGALPVVNDDGRLVGMLTDRDICMAAYTQGQPLRAVMVHTAMSRSVHRCKQGESVADAEALMSRHQIRRIPVVDDGDRPIGLVSLNDIARELTGSPKKADGLRAISTLAAICTPRHSAIRAVPRTELRSLD